MNQGLRHESLSLYCSSNLKLRTRLREGRKLCPYSGHLVKRFCPTVSPYLTLSFSPLINIDGQPDSSGGQNLWQGCSLPPCYHRNGFIRGPPDTGERGNEFMKPSHMYFPLRPHLLLLPSLAPSVRPPIESCLDCWHHTTQKAYST